MLLFKSITIRCADQGACERKRGDSGVLNPGRAVTLQASIQASFCCREASHRLDTVDTVGGIVSRWDLGCFFDPVLNTIINEQAVPMAALPSLPFIKVSVRKQG
ncbi:hypothetical protein AOXY_G36031 [Acipenser oxyrinchus oxyrinchus]|uniref:Uncharacterized protein n=1 Tax=Acipenser oxyrinchus oxyrinchus TaxID=40147 RepID=A0AAD8CFR8_ACIOX|nr:hypothetical protein AOXY_G36031 [Acipenser oxyrinchus oxyrinchus]